MKKIALDLDGVVFDSENLFRVYTEIYDVDKLKKDSIIDNTKRTFQQRYDWNSETKKQFYEENAPIVLKNANLMPGIEVVLPKLIKHYEIIIVTARSKEEVDYAVEKLKSVGLSNIKIHHSKTKKIDILIEEKIDIVIDDDENTCKEASKNNIVGLYFKNTASEKITENKYLKTVNNWGEIYKYLIFKNLHKEK